MMGRLLCLLGLHSWKTTERWEPSINAMIVTLWEFRSTCRRCGRSEGGMMEFDPATGREIRREGMS